MKLQGEVGNGRIIAVARCIKLIDTNWAEVAFILYGAFQGRDIAKHMLQQLFRLAREHNIEGSVADVLASNARIKEVFGTFREVDIAMANGEYYFTNPFDSFSLSDDINP